MLDSLVVSSPSLTICKASQERESSFLNTFWHLVNFWTVLRGGGAIRQFFVARSAIYSCGTVAAGEIRESNILPLHKLTLIFWGDPVTFPHLSGGVYDLGAQLRQEISAFKLWHIWCVTHTWAPSFIRYPSFSSPSLSWVCIDEGKLICATTLLFVKVVPIWLLVAGFWETFWKTAGLH